MHYGSELFKGRGLSLLCGCATLQRSGDRPKGGCCISFAVRPLSGVERGALRRIQREELEGRIRVRGSDQVADNLSTLNTEMRPQAALADGAPTMSAIRGSSENIYSL